jgi:hypothetical protein
MALPDREARKAALQRVPSELRALTKRHVENTYWLKHKKG